MAGEKVGEAYVDFRYRLNQLANDMRAAQATIDNQVGQINRSVQQKTDGMFSGVSTQLQGVTALTGAFGAAILAAVGSQAVAAVSALTGKIAETGNAFQIMQARLDQSLGAGAFQETIQMADRLGVAIKDAAETTSRFGMAAQDIGLTKDQALLLTETVIKLGRIGGSSAVEMSSGMYQLSQSLASGKFQGDELRSVLEAMPELARTLARELGVGIGELRRMGSEGELTAKVVADALLRAANDASERFAKLPESLEQSQARWQNAVDQLYAALDKATKTSSFVQWWNKFRTETAEGIAVSLGGGDAEMQIRVLEGRLRQLEATRLLGRSAEAESLRRQIAELKLTNLPQPELPGLDPELGGGKRSSSWSIYPNRTLEDAKAVKGYLDDAAQTRKEAQAEQERLNKQAEAEAERNKDALERLEQARLMDLRRSIDETVKEEDERLEAVKKANERLAQENQEARKREMQAARDARERAIEDDPAGYYAKTGDQELAPIYDAATGAQDALKELGDQSQQFGKMIGDGIKAGADTAAQALTEMALTGKFAVKDLLRDLAELALNQAFRMAIGGALGAAGSYFFGGNPAAAPTGGGGGPRGYARGGVFDHGHVVPLARGGIVSAATIVPLSRGAALMGEAGPEAVMPLARDGSGRLGVRGGGSGNSFTIVDQRGAGAPQIETQQRQNAGGGMDVTMIIRAEVKKAIGGGHADDAFNARYGIRPRTTR